MMEKNGFGGLNGLKAILEYICMSEPTFKAFVDMGLPARVINGRWYAHKDNIDEFFKQITRCAVGDIPPDAE